MSTKFPKRAVGTFRTLLGVHVNRLSNPLESEKNSIHYILNLMENAPINLNKPTVSDASEKAENINRKCNLMKMTLQFSGDMMGISSISCS